MRRFATPAGALVSLVSMLAMADVTSAAMPPPPSPASGTSGSTTTITAIRFADGNEIVDAVQTGFISGTFSGTVAVRLEGVVHPSGKFELHGVGRISGTVAGCGTGTFAIRADGQGDLSTGTQQVRVLSVDQSSNTLDVHANLVFDRSGAYSGTYFCG